MTKFAPAGITARQAYGRLWRDWLKPYWARLLLIFCLMNIIAVASAGYAKFIQMVIAAFEVSSTSVMIWGPLGVIALTSLKGLAQYGQQVLTTRILSRTQAGLQKKMYASLVDMDLSMLLAESPSALAARFSSDIESASNATREVFSSITAVLTVIATFAVMLSIDWAMTIGLILIFTLAFGPVGIVGSRVRRLGTQTQQEIATMTESVNEGLAGIRMVRTYQLEAHLNYSAKLVFERLEKLRVSMVRWSAAVSPMMEILGGVAVAALLFLVALRMQSGAIDLAGFIGLLTALGVATSPARKLGGAYTAGQQGVASLERIFSLFDAENKIADGELVFKERSKGRIDFEDVGFKYPDGYQALNGLYFTIEPGQTFAFVGRSGAGKSTIFNLLPRLFDVSEGVVRLDGIDIRDIPLRALRDQISVVSQDSVLLSGTVMENIRFGREGATDDECIAAAKAAAADRFISALPKGYQTEIDPSQSSFSGGERQRISIARAILRNAPILLLDEPTSALDAESEAAIRRALDGLSKGRTTLVIAHRLSTILDADQIVVMEQGRLIDIGTNDELLERGGIYADLFNLQFDMGSGNSRRSLIAPNPDVQRSVLGRIAEFFSA